LVCVPKFKTTSNLRPFNVVSMLYFAVYDVSKFGTTYDLVRPFSWYMMIYKFTDPDIYTKIQILIR